MAKILIVEDDTFLSSIIKMRMEKNGFEVEQAFNGEEAIAHLKDGKPDLIVLDMIMPKMSGFEVLQIISTDPEFASIPVLVASNLGQDTDIEKAKSLGATDYFVKVRTPIDELDAMIKNILASRLGPDAIAAPAQAVAPEEVPAAVPQEAAPAEPDGSQPQ